MSPDPPSAPTDTGRTPPVRADVTTTATPGGVLVAVALRNDTAVAVRVRVENDLDGPVLSPRREGVPEAGWDEDGFTGEIPADSELGIGYACPTGDSNAPGRGSTDSAPDPVSVTVLGPADGDGPPASDRVAATVRAVGRSTPPADAVPASPTVDTLDHPDECRAPASGKPTTSGSADVPAPITAWLDGIEARVRRAERLTDATADEAATVLEECGGVDAVAPLSADLDGDLASLRAVGDRIADLAARATSADPDPVVGSLVAASEDLSTTDGVDGGSGGRHESGSAAPEVGRTR